MVSRQVARPLMTLTLHRKPNELIISQSHLLIGKSIDMRCDCGSKWTSGHEKQKSVSVAPASCGGAARDDERERCCQLSWRSICSNCCNRDKSGCGAEAG